jgi:murein DD-endopeptidase MepM/ murein hydrolase activator NlpD
MPDVRADSNVARRWPLLLTGITLVSGAAVMRSTVARLHDQVNEVRRLRARLADRGREVDQQRQEMGAVASAVDRVLSSVRILRSRATEMSPAEGSEDCDVPPAPPRAALARLEDGTTSAPAPTVAMLAWAEEQIGEAGDAFAVLGVTARERNRDARSIPTLWPVHGAVSSGFGWRRSPYGGAAEWHPGIDITAPYGTPVRATADGEVAFAGRDRGYGALVVLDHGATRTRYAHLSAIWVRPGQTVLRGEPLGALGGTGRATGPHLHYEVRLGSEPFDPECLLAGAAGTRLVRAERLSHSCTVVRARLEGRKTPTPARDAAHTTTSRAGVAG